jgi:hypothetical protein
MYLVLVWSILFSFCAAVHVHFVPQSIVISLSMFNLCCSSCFSLCFVVHVQFVLQSMFSLFSLPIDQFVLLLLLVCNHFQFVMQHHVLSANLLCSDIHLKS